MSALDDDIQEILIDAQSIQERVNQLGQRLTRLYEGQVPILVGVLKGAMPFLVDLMRAMAIPLQVDFMAVSSYGRGSRSSGVVRILMDLSMSIEGRDVLIVEDIVDTGLTLEYLRTYLLNQGPRSLRIVALLDKVLPKKADVPLDLVGFRIPNEFVVGYGLDYGERYRNLPYVGILKPNVIVEEAIAQQYAASSSMIERSSEEGMKEFYDR